MARPHGRPSQVLHVQHPSAEQANVSKVASYPHFSCRPHTQGLLDFLNKLHANVYESGCTKCYTDYDVDLAGGHAFIAALTFKAQRMAWTDETVGILNIPTGKCTANGNFNYKSLLESDGEYELGSLYRYIETYISTESRASQDDAMSFSCILNSPSSEGAIKVYNRSADFHCNGQEYSTLLAKVVLEESGLQINATIMKLKDETQELPKLMASYRHNIEKFN